MSDRRCGSCTLCCKLLPVRSPAVDKDAGVRCQHQRSTGCRIYATRPNPCRVWFCAWLLNDDMADCSRPDRVGYVVDMQLDYVTARDDENGAEPLKVPVVQIWVDPARRDAHEDPALRRFLERRGEQGIAALIRYGETEGFTLVPPNMSGDRQWIVPQQSFTEKEHTPAEIAATLAQLRQT